MKTVLHKFTENVSKFGDTTCFLKKCDGVWGPVSWQDFLIDVTGLCLGLQSLGVKKGDSVAIFSVTRYEWTLADIAIMAIGAVTVPIYNTLSRDQVKYILDHSESKVVFVENAGLFETLSEIQGELKTFPKTVLMEGKIEGISNVRELIVKGTPEPISFFNNLIKDLSPEDVASCIYTSGTTGEPKGALITHANIVGETCGLQEIFSFGRDEIGLLFLPLAHVVARAMQFYQLSQGCITAFAESVEKIPENILEVKPHFMVVVPRVMEKIYERIMAEVNAGSKIKKIIFRKSVEIGANASRKLRRRKHLNPWSLIKYAFVKKVVFSKLRKSMGGRLGIVISGGAPLSKSIAEFFHAVGLLVIEGYGLTETMAAITINRPDDFKFGTVGKALPGVSLSIAPDGEVLVKGPQVFKGYRYPVPSDEVEPFKEGWFKTGDIGEFSRDGFLRITGRKKELIVTSAGKNIVPQRVEDIIASSPYIKEILVYGDGKKYLSALVVLDENSVNQYAKQHGLERKNWSELVHDERMYQLIKSEIECKNKELARHETIKRFIILDRGFTQERGELTPTMKVKRKKIYDMYKSEIEKMYENG